MGYLGGRNDVSEENEPGDLGFWLGKSENKGYDAEKPVSGEKKGWVEIGPHV